MLVVSDGFWTQSHLRHHPKNPFFDLASESPFEIPKLFPCYAFYNSRMAFQRTIFKAKSWLRLINTEFFLNIAQFQRCLDCSSRSSPKVCNSMPLPSLVQLELLLKAHSQTASPVPEIRLPFQAGTTLKFNLPPLLLSAIPLSILDVTFTKFSSSGNALWAMIVSKINELCLSGTKFLDFTGAGLITGKENYAWKRGEICLLSFYDLTTNSITQVSYLPVVRGTFDLIYGDGWVCHDSEGNNLLEVGSDSSLSPPVIRTLDLQDFKTLNGGAFISGMADTSWFVVENGIIQDSPNRFVSLAVVYSEFT
jgi:hypothetical protein